MVFKIMKVNIHNTKYSNFVLENYDEVLSTKIKCFWETELLETKRSIRKRVLEILDKNASSK